MVNVDESLKVVLEPVDKRAIDDLGDKVIFIISLERINRAFSKKSKPE